jgi:Concanavalin A-like lectin/glucanases superfamily
MLLPDLIAEVDFTGNPTATYYDTLRNTQGLVSYWRLNSTSTFLDVVGTNNGTVNNAPTLVAGALPNDADQALSFNGTDEDAYVLDNVSLTPDAVSVEMWVKVPSIPGSLKDLVGKRGSYFFQIDTVGKVRFVVKNDTQSVNAMSGAALSTGTYYHLAGVHDPVADTVSLYVDGVLDQTVAYTSGMEITTNPLRFAAFNGTTTPAYASTQTNGGSSASVTCNAPVSIASGDLMIAHFDFADEAQAVTAVPTGWNLLSNSGTATSHRTRVYYKIATGSEPASYTWTMSAGNTWVIAISRFTGANSLSVFANLTYTVETGSVTVHSTGTHLPNLDNCHVLGLVSSRNSGTWTMSETERYDTNGGGGANSIAMGSVAQTTASNLAITGTQAVAAHGTAVMIVLSSTGLTYTPSTLDDVTLWNRALSAAEVDAHYQSRLSGVGAWQSVSSDARSLSVRYGRQYELNRMEAGTATTVLKNQHRKYDPANTSSVYFPNVKPNRKIRFRALLNGVYYPLFEGFVERWPSSWEVPHYDEITLTATDGFKPLNLAGISGTLNAGLSGTQIGTILDKAFYPSDTRDLDAGLFVMAADTSTGTTQALGVIQDIEDSELGVFFCNHTVDRSPATLHDRSHRWSDARSINSQATFSDQAFIPYLDLVPSDDDDNMVNEWQVTTADGTLKTAVDVISRAENFPVTKQRSTRLDNPPDAALQATALLQQTAKPTLRFDALTLRLTAATPLATWQTALTLAISDRVTVIRNPVPAAGGSTITKPCFIEAINWTITPAVWQVSYQLSPVSTGTYYDTIIRDQPVSYWRFDSTT